MAKGRHPAYGCPFAVLWKEDGYNHMTGEEWLDFLLLVRYRNGSFALKAVCYSVYDDLGWAVRHMERPIRTPDDLLAAIDSSRQVLEEDAGLDLPEATEMNLVAGLQKLDPTFAQELEPKLAAIAARSDDDTDDTDDTDDPEDGFE